MQIFVWMCKFPPAACTVYYEKIGKCKNEYTTVENKESFMIYSAFCGYTCFVWLKREIANKFFKEIFFVEFEWRNFSSLLDASGVPLLFIIIC